MRVDPDAPRPDPGTDPLHPRRGQDGGVPTPLRTRSRASAPGDRWWSRRRRAGIGCRRRTPTTSSPPARRGPRSCVLAPAAGRRRQRRGRPPPRGLRRSVRWTFVLLTLAGGAGIAAYVFLWALTPEGDVDSDPAQAAGHEHPTRASAVGPRARASVGARRGRRGAPHPGARGLGVIGSVLVPLFTIAVGAIVAWSNLDDAQRSRWIGSGEGATAGCGWRWGRPDRGRHPRARDPRRVGLGRLGRPPRRRRRARRRALIIAAPWGAAAVGRPAPRAGGRRPRHRARRHRRPPARLGAADPRAHPAPGGRRRARSPGSPAPRSASCASWLYAGTPPARQSTLAAARHRGRRRRRGPPRRDRSTWSSPATAPRATARGAGRRPCARPCSTRRGTAAPPVSRLRRGRARPRSRPSCATAATGSTLDAVPEDRLGVRAVDHRADGSGTAVGRVRCRRRATAPRCGCGCRRSSGRGTAMSEDHDRCTRAGPRSCSSTTTGCSAPACGRARRDAGSRVVGEAADVDAASRGDPRRAARRRAARRAPAGRPATAGSTSSAALAPSRAGHRALPRAVGVATPPRTSSRSSAPAPAATSPRRSPPPT